VPNRHIYSRLSYLHQAAQYLTNQQYTSHNAGQGSIVTRTAEEQNEVEANARLTEAGAAPIGEDKRDGRETEAPAPSIENHLDSGLPRQLASHMLLVSTKSNTKLSQRIKRSICKRCTSVLIAGRTAEIRIENKSRGSRKPWAEVLVTTCIACGMEKRYPVGVASCKRLQSGANG
jgi:ribonuclease P protein subunit RPR2